MRNTLMIAVAASALIAGLSSGPAAAQHRGGDRPPATVPPASGRGDLDRTQDRLRTDVPDQDRDRLQDKDRTGDSDQDRDRDRLRTSQVVDDQLASLSLLTSEERTLFRNQMRAATTAEERNRIRAEHQKVILERAREMGVGPPMGTGQGAGAAGGMGMGSQSRSGYMLMTMLSEQERAQFMNRMRSAQTAQEREQIRNEMHVMAQQRAREIGIDVPAWYGRGQGPR
jgi:hypothetical protein